jgi:hypothetical protein
VDGAETEGAPLVPTTPIGLAITNGTSGPALTWNGVAGATSYTIQRSADPYANYGTVGSSATATFTDTSATAGVPVWYRIVAVDGTGSSSPSTPRVGAKLAAVGSAPAAVVALNLYPTFHSIDVELVYTGDTDMSAIARLEYKQQAETVWRAGFPLWPISDPTDATYFAHLASILFVAPNTTYDVRITIADSGGVTGITNGAIQGSVTTIAEDIPAASTLTPTHYVATTGSDGNAGTSSGAPWATVGKALTVANASTADMVIQFAPGYYVPSNTLLVGNGHRITLKAQYPAVDDSGALINAGQHTVFEPARGSRPAGSAATGDNTGLIEAPWVLVDGTTVNSYTIPSGSNIYMWAGSPLSSVSQLGYSSTRAGHPQRVTNFAVSGVSIDGNALNWLLTADMYRYGFMFSNTASSTIYLRLPPTAPSSDPNTLYITLGRNAGISLSGTVSPPAPVNGAVHRVTGFEFRTFSDGINIGENADRCVVDHNFTASCLNGTNCAANSSTGRGAITPVIQYNLFKDTNLRAALGAPSDPTVGLIPWTFIKAPTIGTAGSQGTVSSLRSAQASESNGIYGNRGALRPIIRYNVMDGVFNGVSMFVRANRNASAGMDCYRNVFKNINDDCHENEESAQWWKMWDNYHENILVVLSAAPAQTGPVYHIANRAWQINQTNSPSNLNTYVDNGVNVRKGGSGYYCKINGAASVNAHIHMYNNTCWTSYGQDEFLGNQALDTRIWSTAGGGVNAGIWDARNNILRVGHRTNSGKLIGEDYNVHAVSGTRTVSSAVGLQWTNGTVYRTAAEFANYRTVSGLVYPGNGQHSNILGGVTRAVDAMDALLNAQLSNPSAGDMSLVGGAELLTAGQPLPMISPSYDPTRIGYITPTIDGEAPPVGPPNAPSVLTATVVSASRIDLSWTDNATDESGFVVERSTDGTTYTPIGTTAANVTTFIASGLNGGTAYWFRVKSSKDIAP